MARIDLPDGYRLLVTAPDVWVLVALRSSRQVVARYHGALVPQEVERDAREHAELVRLTREGLREEADGRVREQADAKMEEILEVAGAARSLPPASEQGRQVAPRRENVAQRQPGQPERDPRARFPQDDRQGARQGKTHDQQPAPLGQ